MKKSTEPTNQSAAPAAPTRAEGAGAAAGDAVASGTAPCPAPGVPTSPDEGASSRVEAVSAGAGFCLALIAFVLVVPGPVYAPALLMVALLAAGYFGVSVHAARHAVARAAPGGLAGAALGPLILWGAAGIYAGIAGLPVLPRLVTYAVYLAVPTLLVAAGPAPAALPELGLLAAVVLGATVKFHLLPGLPLPPHYGVDGIRLVALVAAFWLFLVRPGLERIGYTFALRRRDFALALGAFAVYAVVALPVGLGLHFLTWAPRLTPLNTLLTPITIYIETAVPEEFLFRGLIQNLLARRLGDRPAWVVASLVFGLSHLPDPRYAFLAFVAGLAYGWTYRRTGRITASAVTHAAVDWIWVLLLHG